MSQLSVSKLSPDRPIRWGFLGAGGIAASMATDLHHGNNMLYSVAARDVDRAAAFAGRFGAAHSYGDYRAVIEDPEVDVVYVATTHPFHREQALMAIDAGKPVLIEKPLALNAAQAREVTTAARDRGIFAMEAVWMRANPLILKARALVARGDIGDVLAVHADFSIGLDFDPAHRLFDLANGGGALLDLGVYPMHFAWLFLGRPDNQQVVGTLSPTGSDATAALQWGYRSGATAQLRCATTGLTPGRATIAGPAGPISVRPWVPTPRPPVTPPRSRGARGPSSSSRPSGTWRSGQRRGFVRRGGGRRSSNPPVWKDARRRQCSPENRLVRKRRRLAETVLRWQ